MKAHYPFWLALFCLMGFCALFYSVQATYALWNYRSLSAKTIAQKIDWTIVEHSTEEYALEATYTYSVANAVLIEKDLFDKPLYRNRWAAEQEAKERNQSRWVVWYRPNQPRESSLQKRFPLKECVYALVMIGLAGYFAWLYRTHKA